jgi:hypothetical protein
VVLANFDQGSLGQAAFCYQFNRVRKRHHVVSPGVQGQRSGFSCLYGVCLDSKRYAELRSAFALMPLTEFFYALAVTISRAVLRQKPPSKSKPGWEHLFRSKAPTRTRDCASTRTYLTVDQEHFHRRLAPEKRTSPALALLMTIGVTLA